MKSFTKEKIETYNTNNGQMYVSFHRLEELHLIGTLKKRNVDKN